MRTWNGQRDSLPKVLRPFASIIDDYYTETEDGRKNHWVELINGLMDSESDCHGMHETSLSKVVFRLRHFVVPCTIENCSDMRDKAIAEHEALHRAIALAYPPKNKISQIWNTKQGDK